MTIHTSLPDLIRSQGQMARNHVDPEPAPEPVDPQPEPDDAPEPRPADDLKARQLLRSLILSHTSLSALVQQRLLSYISRPGI